MRIRGSIEPEIEVYSSFVPFVPDIEFALRIIQKNERGR